MTQHIDSDRLWQSLMQLAEVGSTPKGGVCRLALTDLDRQGRDLFVTWCRDAGLSVRVDAIGNIFARRDGSDPNRRAVAMGSHIDTQPTGGKFDGNFGVLAGLEVLRTLADAGIRTAAPLEVVVWTNEEGSRFVPVMMGSGVFSGAFSLNEVLSQQDLEGLTVADELDRIGYAGSQIPGEVPNGMFDAYFEAHIEQGPVLEAHDLSIGVVPGALGQRWYDIVVTGSEAHAGPTPMNQRHDALLAASKIVQRINQIGSDFGPHGRGTVGFMQVMPNSRNTIPGAVKFSVDLRALSDDVLAAMDLALKDCCATLMKNDPLLTIAANQVVYFKPCHFDHECIRLVRDAAETLGFPHMDVVSGAGHDAVYLSAVAPTAMIFVPCKNGISHNELEEVLQEHLAAGANVLLHAVLARAS